MDRWRFGAVGGALGSLPLLALARTAAARLFSVTRLPGAERAAADVKQASYLEAAVVLLAVPAAAAFFGVIVPRLLRARGRPAWAGEMPGVAFAFGFLVWRAGMGATAALFVGSALAAVAAHPEAVWQSRSRALAAALALGLFAAGVSAYRSEGTIDLFEDGQILLGARTLAHGGRPYLDFYPVHGWGADGGWDAAAFRMFGERLDVFRWRRAIVTALALVLLAATCALFFRDLGRGAVALVACLAFCPLVSERQAPAFACWCVLVVAAQSRSTKAWFAAGAVAGAALFSTLDFGAAFLLAGATAPFLLAVLERRRLSGAGRTAARFALGALAGAFPFLLWLSLQGALPAFGRSLVEVPGEVTGGWGRPAPSLAQAMRAGTFSNLPPGVGLLLPMGVLALAGAILAVRAAERTFGERDRAAAVSVLVGAIALRGALGRSEQAHWMLYGVFAGLPAAWLVFEAARARRRELAFSLAAVAFFVLLRPDRVVAVEAELVSRAPARRREERAASVRAPGLGGAVLPREQALDLLELKAAVDRAAGPGETFADFGNEPALYFFLGRRAPIRYHCVPSFETEERQQEVIVALERERPSLAILASGTGRDGFDGVSNRERAPLVARYLESRYRVVGRVGSRTLAIRDDSGDARLVGEKRRETDFPPADSRETP